MRPTQENAWHGVDAVPDGGCYRRAPLTVLPHNTTQSRRSGQRPQRTNLPTICCTKAGTIKNYAMFPPYSLAQKSGVGMANPIEYKQELVKDALSSEIASEWQDPGPFNAPPCGYEPRADPDCYAQAGIAVVELRRLAGLKLQLQRFTGASRGMAAPMTPGVRRVHGHIRCPQQNRKRACSGCFPRGVLAPDLLHFVRRAVVRIAVPKLEHRTTHWQNCSH